MHLLAFTMRVLSLEDAGLIATVRIAGVVCLLIAVCWALLRKFQKVQGPYPYTLQLLAGSGLAIVTIVFVLWLVLPPAPMH